MAASRETRVRRGRAYVRLIEVLDVLLANDPHNPENDLLEFFRRLASQRLAHLVRELDAAAVERIVVAVDKPWRTADEISLN